MAKGQTPILAPTAARSIWAVGWEAVPGANRTWVKHHLQQLWASEQEYLWEANIKAAKSQGLSTVYSAPAAA